MIDLRWDTNGRIGRRAFQQAQRGRGFMTIAGVLVAGFILFSFVHKSPLLTDIIVGAVMLGVVYLQYRNVQLSIRRLHDRDLSGWFFIPAIVFGAVALGYSCYAIMLIVMRGGWGEFLYDLPGLISPAARVFFYKGIGFWAAAFFILYNLFIAYNLGARGKPADNSFGPAADD